MIRLSGKNIEVPLQNVHVPVTVGNIVTFSYTPHAKRDVSSDTVSIHRVRHDVDWFNNTSYKSSSDKSMYFFSLYLHLIDFKKIFQNTNCFLKIMQKIMNLIHLFLRIGIFKQQKIFYPLQYVI
jgi:hypothetical protein